MANLTRVEAEARAALIDVTAYRLEIDLDQGERTFESTSRVSFVCRHPGASTFLDLKPEAVHSITLNGKAIDPASLADERVVLSDLAAENEVVVSATMRYSNDGQGLHRAVDPADGQAYVYGHLVLDAAPRVFACFDQPNLKAAYDVTVTAPRDWTVIGNGDPSTSGDGQWQLATTKPLATYFVTICAGPYVSVSEEHDGIPLAVHARASLREPLERQAGQIFEVTKASFDYYHSLFGIRYPFGEYHQVFVPEFNAGAMENPGCVTFRDQLIFRGATTRSQILARSNTIAHEMAHMWFGDMVTMNWWDDLWLNESFAEYMAHRTTSAVTEFTESWVDATMVRKVWGYAAERMPSAHPVAGSPAPDARSALQNFDGISYAKGSAVLRELIAYIGDDAFLAGLGVYLREHLFGNATFADFLGAMERASGKDLGPWADAWLRTAGLDAISVETQTADGRVIGATVRRTPPPRHLADRPHAFDVAGFTAGAEVFRVETVLDRDASDLGELVGRSAPAVLLPNASDLTWANIKLDAATVDALPTELAAIEDATARAVIWTALLDGVALAEIDPRQLIRIFEGAWCQETNPSILGAVAAQLSMRVVPAFLPESEHAAAQRVLARAGQELLSRAEAGSSDAIAAARLVASATDDRDLLERWVAGTDVPAGLVGDSDFAWISVGNLAARGHLDTAGIDAVLARDDTMAGNLSALQAKASRPDADAKAWAWEQLTTDAGRSNYEMNSLAMGFWFAEDLEVVRPYVSRYFSDVPAMGGRVGEDALDRVAQLAYPRSVVEQATSDATTAALERADLSSSVRRAMVDQQEMLLQAVRSRAAFASRGPGPAAWLVADSP